jgi:membrane associated rhomboid family serine protease
MFPYKDENPTERPAVVTVAIIAANVLVWLFVQGAGLSQEQLARSVCQLGLVPGEVLGGAKPGSGVELVPGLYCLVDAVPNYLTVLTSMFTHGGWFHLIGNMVFLWVFGNNIEDAMGHVKFILFYLLCGVAAAATQTFLSPHSIVPMVGASGAISGVLGAYLLLYPRVRVHTLIILPIYITTVALPAYVMLGYWIVLQLLGGVGSLSEIERGGVAFFAHVGGFIAGLVLVRLFVSEDVLRRRPTPPAEYYRYRTPLG